MLAQTEDAKTSLLATHIQFRRRPESVLLHWTARGLRGPTVANRISTVSPKGALLYGMAGDPQMGPGHFSFLAHHSH